jgi:ABC-2 family transporter protein
MSIGLFLRREIITSTRRGAAFSERWQGASAAGLLVVGCFAVWDWWGWDRVSVAGAASFGFAMFGVLILAELMLTTGLVASTTAAAIASERDRKSLDSLLATPVSAADVVLGALGATFLRHVNRLAALAPIVVLIMFLGGIDPRLVALAFAGLASTAVVTASLSVAISAGTRTSRHAVAYTVTLGTSWISLPPVALLLLPRVWPAVVPWVAPVAVRMLDGSPLGVVTSVLGVIPRGPLVPSVLRMIAIHATASSALVAWAIVRLRPSSRALHDLEGRAAYIRALRARWRPRPACGDDPVLWREMYSRPTARSIEFVIARLLNMVWMGLLAYFIWLFAAPAFVEMSQRGYGPGPSDAAYPELNPMARMLVAKASGLPMIAATGRSRLDFNIVLRQVTGILGSIYFLVLAGTASESVMNERERDTWLGLIATPLTGWEILRAKMLGTLWKTRSMGLLILSLWTVGLLTGALHPLGFLAGIVAACVFCWLGSILGVSISLWSLDRAQATNRMLAPMVLVFSLGALPFVLPGLASYGAAAGSPPFQVWAVLFSYDDVRDLIRSNGVRPYAAIGVGSAVDARLLLAAILASVAAQAAAAGLLVRIAARGFDAAVGRPVRGRFSTLRDGSWDCSPGSTTP